MAVNNSFSIIPEIAIAQIIYFLPQEGRNSLALVDKTMNAAVKVFEIRCYENFKKNTDSLDNNNNKYVCYSFVNPKGITSIGKKKIGTLLGRGGSKEVYDLGGLYSALVIPNMNVDSFEDIAARWKRIVDEEVKMSEFLASVGLLAPKLIPTRVAYSDLPGMSIPAYRAIAFSDLFASEGLYVIDRKNPESSTWKKGQNFLFNSTEERLDEKNWDFVFDSFLTDILKICTGHLPTKGDSVNIAINLKFMGKDKDEFEVRYFGFDFTNKQTSIFIPQVEKNTTYRLKLDSNKAKTLIEKFLSVIFAYEFVNEYADGSVDENKIYDLRKNLEDKYLKLLENKMRTPQYFTTN